MGVENGLGETGGTGGEVDGGLVLLGEGTRGKDSGTLGDEVAVVVGKHRTTCAHIDKVTGAADLIRHRLHTAHKLGAEDQHVRLRQRQAIINLVGGVTIVQRHRQSACF